MFRLSDSITKARLSKCSSLKELSLLVNTSSSLSDQSLALRIAGKLILKNPSVHQETIILSIQQNLKKKVQSLTHRDLLNYVYFLKASRESKNYPKEEFDSDLLSMLEKIFKLRILESSDMVNLYHDAKRIRADVFKIDEYMIEWLLNKNLWINIIQLKIVIRTVLNSTSIFNGTIVRICFKKIEEINFDFKLNNIVIEMLEVIFDVDLKLVYYDSKGLMRKILEYLEQAELEEKDFHQIFDYHLKFNKWSTVLDLAIDRFLTQVGNNAINSSEKYLSFVLLSCRKIESHKDLKGFIKRCVGTLVDCSKINKYHIFIAEGLIKYEHLISPEDSVKIISMFNISNLQKLDTLLKIHCFQYLKKKKKQIELKFLEDLSGKSVDYLLEAYLALKMNYERPLDSVEQSLKNTIKKHLTSSFYFAKSYVSFYSKPSSDRVKQILQELSIEFLPTILTYYTGPLSKIRIVFSLFYPADPWHKAINSIIDKEADINFIEFIENNHVESYNISALKLIYDRSKTKSPAITTSLVLALMNPNFLINK